MFKPILVTADLHGEYDAYIRLCKYLQNYRNHYHWTPQPILVIAGDHGLFTDTFFPNYGILDLLSMTIPETHIWLLRGNHDARVDDTLIEKLKLFQNSEGWYHSDLYPQIHIIPDSGYHFVYDDCSDNTHISILFIPGATNYPPDSDMNNIYRTSLYPEEQEKLLEKVKKIKQYHFNHPINYIISHTAPIPFIYEMGFKLHKQMVVEDLLNEILSNQLNNVPVCIYGHFHKAATYYSYEDSFEIAKGIAVNSHSIYNFSNKKLYLDV